jgi:hypothetical protein
MIVTPSYSIPKGVNSGVFSIVNRRYCKELEDVIAVAKSKCYQLPTDYQLRVINFCINEKKSNGILERLDLFYLMGLNSLIVQDSFNTNLVRLRSDSLKLESTIFPFCSLNIKNPISNQLTKEQGTTAQQGITSTRFGLRCNGSGSTNWAALNTNWSPSEGINYTQNNAHFSLLINGDFPVTANGGNRCLGIRNGSSPTHTSVLLNFQTSTSFAGHINRGANSTITFSSGMTNGYGQYVLERTASNLVTAYKNGTSVGTNTGASGALPSDRFYLFTENLGGVPSTSSLTSGANYVSFQLGASLGATLQKIDYEIMKEFRTRLGFNWIDAI